MIRNDHVGVRRWVKVVEKQIRVGVRAGGLSIKQRATTSVNLVT
jgi:hypothetical protein